MVLVYYSEIAFFAIRGEVWKKLKPGEKYEYIQGFFDGLAFAQLKIQGQEIVTKTSCDHIIGAIDQFYSDCKNELIPVPHALKIISMELSGRPSILIESELKELRKIMYRIDKQKTKKEY